MIKIVNNEWLFVLLVYSAYYLNFNKYLKMPSIYSLAFVGFGMSSQKSYKNDD